MSDILAFQSILFHLQKKKEFKKSHEITKNPNFMENNSRIKNIAENFW